MSSEGSANHPHEAADRFAELSAILVGAERGQIAELRQRLENPQSRSEDVAEVLAEAVRLRSSRDNRLRRALQPTIEEAIGISVRRNPRLLAEALFPIFGKAIRRAIGAELNGMVQSLTQVLEQSFSLRSLKWRLEALRTGRPYAEIVLLRSLLYRVEQVFLIHRESGLLLLHAEKTSGTLKDPEMVSGMLTAIQDFVRDSISGAEGEDLETVRVGSYTVLLAYGPRAILAGFVRGVLARNLNRLFQDELDSIHEELAVPLASFTGDTAAFEAARPRLEKCLVGQGDPAAGPRKESRIARSIVFGVPLLLLCLLAGWWFLSARAQRRWSGLVERIGAQPGIVITDAGKRGGRYFLSGLRDPLAVDPVELARNAGIPPDRMVFRWEAYHSLQPQFVARRRYTAARERLEKLGVRFAVGSARVPLEQYGTVNEAAAQIGALFDAAAASRREVSVEILGGTDPTGREALNATLAKDRALAVQSALVALGVSRHRLRASGLSTPCALATGGSAEQCRAVALRVREDAR